MSRQEEEKESDVRNLRLDPEELQVAAMISEGGSVVRPKVPWGSSSGGSEPPHNREDHTWRESLRERTHGKLSAFVKRSTSKIAEANTRLGGGVGQIPERIHRVARQSSLLLELISDYQHGRYRQVPEHSMAIIVGAVLYAVNPADLLPESIPVVGAIDDLAVLAVAMRLVRRDLREYCKFKGYALGSYFPHAA